MPGAAFLSLHTDGLLRPRAQQALARMTACTLCARRCGADRSQGIRRASCQIGARAKVASANIDANGIADILFAGCNLRCLGCSTAAASWDCAGEEMDADGLAALLLAQQARDARMVMLSSPSHVPAHILDALCRAADGGFRLPLAWATGGYDSLDTLTLLDGVIDLYVVDFKHGDGAAARQCAGIGDYPQVASAAVAEMHRQVGSLRRDDGGRPLGGVLVRHLVLPHDLAGSAAVFAALPAGTAVQVLGGYQPLHRASRAPKLNRRPSVDEVAAGRQAAVQAGMQLLD